MPHGEGRTMSSDWLKVVQPTEESLQQHGASPLGVDWAPRGADLEARFEAHLDILGRAQKGPERPILLDLGCGPGLLLDYLQFTGRLEAIDYRGIDMSPLMIASARERWPNQTFEVRDILADPLPPGSVDVVIMNGVITNRRDIPRERFVTMAEELVAAAFRTARLGISFNAMNSHVNFARDDRFQWGFDELAAFLRREVTPHFAFRADYGLNDFTTYAWHDPCKARDYTVVEWWDRH